MNTCKSHLQKQETLLRGAIHSNKVYKRKQHNNKEKKREKDKKKIREGRIILISYIFRSCRQRELGRTKCVQSASTTTPPQITGCVLTILAHLYPL